MVAEGLSFQEIFDSEVSRKLSSESFWLRDVVNASVV